MLPPLQGDFHMHPSQEVQDTLSPYEYARLNHVEPLAAWVCTNGGYVNTSLDIGTSPTLGCRLVQHRRNTFWCSPESGKEGGDVMVCV